MTIKPECDSMIGFTEGNKEVKHRCEKEQGHKDEHIWSCYTW